MAKKAEVKGFTPTGVVYQSTKLPKPTSKTHDKLGLKKKDLLNLFESMYRQRRFEERAAQMYQKGKFGGFLHLYIGQEAISSGVVQALNDDDDLITAYRDHGFALARGASSDECMAELFGKATGLSKGKGGSMHYFKLEKHFWGGHAIVGAHIPLGAGLAFANKYNGNDRVAVCFFGDGAVDQGSLNETFNMAQLWKLPVIFVVENNGYSMGTAVERHSAGDLHKRADAYGMKNDVVNGMDVFTIIEKFTEVAKDVRKNQEPWFLEVRTYRYRGHSMSDPGNYRTKEELEEFKQTDPIERLKTYVSEKKLVKDEEIEEITSRIEQEVLDAIDFAEESDFPEPEALFHDVYVENDFPFVK
jgi:pyruvate dehydrogenase E1 component alpha subunit